jgi:hypothetical protein
MVPRAYNDSFTKDLFADEDLGGDEGLDVVESPGHGHRTCCHEEIRVGIGRTVL